MDVNRKIVDSFRWALCALVVLFAANTFALDVRLQGSYKGGAILTIDGKQRVVKEGRRSPEGVLVVSATSKNAVIEIDGKKQTITMQRGISTSFKEAEKGVARIAPGRGGHYYTPGRINGVAVQFMVDTGATSIAMNLESAKKIGINYRAGKEITVSTANGLATAYRVTLDSVRIGDVEVRNVDAAVSLTNFPTTILLGNSFLGRVDMRRDDGVLILESTY